jgi:hypothetical protein
VLYVVFSEAMGINEVTATRARLTARIGAVRRRG